jgi:hypothetical protein
MYSLRKELKEKNSEIDLLHDELALYKRQVEMLTTALRLVQFKHFVTLLNWKKYWHIYIKKCVFSAID